MKKTKSNAKQAATASATAALLLLGITVDDAAAQRVRERKIGGQEKTPPATGQVEPGQGENANQQSGSEVAPIPVRRERKSRRGTRGGESPPTTRPGDPESDFIFPTQYRRVDGYGNNVENPEWGTAESLYLRRVPAAYADGVSEPSGTNRPCARAVSNAVVAQSEDLLNSAGASDFVWQWGQFLDHDLDETPTADPAEPFGILVPAGDPFFDPTSSGNVTIGMNRSDYELHDGVRQQINEITAYIDASNVYGSDEERAFALRTLDGTGRLATSEGDLLPFNTAGLANAPSSAAPNFFLAGDVRANEQVGLTAMHTIFVREHNHWAATMAEANPRMSGEEIYQSARSIVAAEMQAITFNEFIPVLLGEDAVPRYQGYNPQVNAGIANGFAAAAYRLGHSMLSGELLCLDADLRTVDTGNLSLAQSFFDPGLMTSIGPAPVLRGLCVQQCQEIDTMLVDEVRNFLFGPPGAGGFDLASLNIQRGRDHGLPSYNAVRRAYGLAPVRNFSDIAEPATAERLASVYVSVDDVDPWVGMLAERHVRGAMVGETLRAVLGDQFRRTRDGDRFWYLNYLADELAQVVEEQTLATIIRRNSEIGDEIPDDVFRVAIPRARPTTPSRR